MQMAVAVVEVAQHAGDRAAHRPADGGETLDPRQAREHLMGEVEGHQGDGQAAGEDDRRGLGIDEDVELGMRRHVAADLRALPRP